jgi:hypothetical protein
MRRQRLEGRELSLEFHNASAQIPNTTLRKDRYAEGETGHCKAPTVAWKQNPLDRGAEVCHQRNAEQLKCIFASTHFSSQEYSVG